jgi:alpha-beta hydrolase superfamily lysophospholipase
MTGHEGEWVEPASGRRFAYRCWGPERPRALLVLLHGFGEHGGRYAAFAETLADQGIEVAAPDLWAHGRSGGARGDLGRAEPCVRQLQRMTDTVFLPRAGCSGYALFGHSFGGLLAILWSLEPPPALRRVILQSPLLEVGFPLPAWTVAAAALLRVCWPGAPFAVNLDVRALSRDPAVAASYASDPLVHNRMTAGTYGAIQEAERRAMAGASRCDRPTLLLLGEADRIVSVAAAHRWFDRLSCEKRRVVFPGGFHELHHEPVRDEVARLVSAWALGA